MRASRVGRATGSMIVGSPTLRTNPDSKKQSSHIESTSPSSHSQPLHSPTHQLNYGQSLLTVLRKQDQQHEDTDILDNTINIQNSDAIDSYSTLYQQLGSHVAARKAMEQRQVDSHHRRVTRTESTKAAQASQLVERRRSQFPTTRNSTSRSPSSQINAQNILSPTSEFGNLEIKHQRGSTNSIASTQSNTSSNCTILESQKRGRRFEATKPEDALDKSIRNAYAGTELIHVQKELTYTRLTEMCLNPPRLTHVIELKLAGNALDRLPDGLHKVFPILQVLDITQNDLVYLPESIGSFKNLLELSVSYNKLIRLPDSLGQLKTLHQLRAGGNQIDCLPQTIGKLQLLTKISLENNKILDLPETFKSVIQLHELNLSNNKMQTLALLPTRAAGRVPVSLDNESLGSSLGLDTGEQILLKSVMESEVDEQSDDEWDEVLDPVTDEYAYVNRRTNEAKRSLANFNEPLINKSPFGTGSVEDGSEYVTDDSENDTIVVGHVNSTQLAEGWYEAFDNSSGQPYFVNPSTDETRWEKPLQKTKDNFDKRLTLNFSKLRRGGIGPSTKDRIGVRKRWLGAQGIAEWSYSFESETGRAIFKDEITGSIFPGDGMPKRLDTLGNLRYLNRLIISCNQLSELPESIGQCIYLRHINLSFNMLRGLPASMAALSKLEYLNINSNRMTSLPSFVGNLEVLEELRADSNYIESIPRTIGHCIHLRTLSIVDNKLSELPRDLGSLSDCLKNFMFSGNKITLPSQVIVAKGLQAILFDCRQRQNIAKRGAPPKGTQMRDVGLGGEHQMIEPEFDKRLVAALRVSRETHALGLHFLGLSCLPLGFDKNIDAKSLEEVRMTGNKFKEFPQEFSRLLQLRILHLVNNKIETIPSPSLQDTQLLIRLDLSDNLLESLPATICRLANLEYLALSGNKLKNIPNRIGDLKNLKELRLEKNNLIDLPASFGSLIQLNKVYLTGNQINQLPDSIGGLINLTELHVSQNKLSELPASMGELGKVHTLRVARNQLHIFPNAICSGAISLSLHTLNMQANHMVQLPAMFRGLTALVDLAYDMNPIRNPPPELANKGVVMVMGYIKERAERIEHLKLVMKYNRLKFSEEAMEPKSENVLIGSSVRYVRPMDIAAFDKQVDQYINADFYEYTKTAVQIVSEFKVVMELRERAFHRRVLDALVLVIETAVHHNLFIPFVFLDNIQQKLGNGPLADCFIFKLPMLFHAIHAKREVLFPEGFDETVLEKPKRRNNNDHDDSESDSDENIDAEDGSSATPIDPWDVKNENMNKRYASNAGLIQPKEKKEKEKKKKKKVEVEKINRDPQEVVTYPSVLEMLHERELLKVKFQYDMKQVETAIMKYRGPYGKVGRAKVRFYFPGEIEPKKPKRSIGRFMRRGNKKSKGKSKSSKKNEASAVRNTKASLRDVSIPENQSVDVPSGSVSENVDGSQASDDYSDSQDDGSSAGSIGSMDDRESSEWSDEDEDESRSEDGKQDIFMKDGKQVKAEPMPIRKRRSSWHPDEAVRKRRGTANAIEELEELREEQARKKFIEQEAKFATEADHAKKNSDIKGTRPSIFARPSRIARHGTGTIIAVIKDKKILRSQASVILTSTITGVKGFVKNILESKEKDFGSLIANARNRALGMQNQIIGGLIQLKKEHKFDQRGVCVLQQLIYTDEEVKRKEAEDERVENYIVKMLNRAAVWRASGAGKARMKIEITRQKQRTTDKVSAVNALVADAEAKFAAVRVTAGWIDKRVDAFKAGADHEEHRFNSRHAMLKAQKQVSDDIRAALGYRDQVTREQRRLINIQGKSAAQWRDDLDERLMGRVAQRTREDIVSIMRKEALRNNLRRPWDGKHGADFRAWVTEYMRYRVDKGDSDSESDEEIPERFAKDEDEDAGGLGDVDPNLDPRLMYDYGFESDEEDEDDADDDSTNGDDNEDKNNKKVDSQEQDTIPKGAAKYKLNS